ncbi:cysteine and tyrosine-rich protein 1-like [Ostrea edulis]|uniref:cysteine and tyrosine-rich protein 1-like n=1 Tax=Ostrea edulis TaxID=37623 RepID=UPI0024AFC560|nr:cysteine and tyrosine-rich protein 1-like [Ostrea edulis]
MIIEPLLILSLTILTEISGEETYCVNRNDRFPCEHGCCGDYKDQHCCSFAGLIVGIIVGVALLIAVIAGIIYCWLKKHWRKESRDPMAVPSHNCRGANVTVLHQSRTMAFTTGSSNHSSGLSPYDLTFNQQFPPPYSAQVPQAPKYSPPQARKFSPPPYSQAPPPYSAKTPAQRTTLHSIGSESNIITSASSRIGPPPVS